MNVKRIKKWIVVVLVVVSFLSICSYIMLNHEINQLWGKYTTQVDYEQFDSPQIEVIIKDVNVLSPDASKMIAKQMVRIKAGKIIEVGANIANPKDALVINGQGKYLIPGLIDSHVHLWQSPNDLLLYIANGVTHIKELNGSEEHLVWKKEIQEGRMGPNMFVTSSRLNSTTVSSAWFEEWTAKISSINTFNPADRFVQGVVDNGYDAIKIYTFLDNEDFSSVSKAAKKAGIPVLGHLPIDLGFEKFWDSDLKELAHIEELVKELDREFGGFSSTSADEYLAYVNKRSDYLVSNLVKNDIAVVSTLWLMESFANQKADINTELKKVELQYVNPGISEGTRPSVRAMGWLPDVNIYRLPDDYPHANLAGNRKYWETYAKANQILLRAMAEKGVQILAGSDANVPVAVPGFSLHDELRSMTRAGMTPSQVLLSATVAPANSMNIKAGKIVQGYDANLLLLNKNPLLDIENTKTINSVIINGRLLQRNQLDAMLEAVQKANDESRKKNINDF